MPEKYTAKTFQPALLASLGELSGYTEGRPVAMKDVIEAVLRRLDMDADTLGEKHGKLETHRLIGLAFRGAKTIASPLTSSPVKGQWALTKRGIDQARQVVGPVAPNVRVVPADEPTDEVEPDARHVYEADPYIRTLAIAKTPCFGYLHDPKHPTCESCVLAPYCQEALWDRCRTEHDKPRPVASAPAARITESAQALDFIDSKEEAAQKIDELLNDDLVLTEDQISRATRITTKKAMDCQKCAQRIPNNTEVFFVSPLGVFHIACFQALRRPSKEGATTP